MTTSFVLFIQIDQIKIYFPFFGSGKPHSLALISPAEFQCVSCAMRLSVAYSTGYGGTCTIIGTGPTLLTKGQADVSVTYMFFSRNEIF